MLTLGFETTCDETSCSVVLDDRKILSNVIVSQASIHSAYGGVIPELACRQHAEALRPVLEEALTLASVSLADIDLFAAAIGPGLIGALLVGVNAAKALSLSLNKPWLGVNHIEAHLYAAWMSSKEDLKFPCLGVVLSGGHTTILKIMNWGRYELISQTVDDAIGEAFDKVAKLLGWPYPGGPNVEAQAKYGDPKKYNLKAGKVKEKPLFFSFSGLKTAVLYTIQKEINLTEQKKRDLASAFQETAFQDVITKTIECARIHECQTILFGGGVTNNKRLRELFELHAKNLKLLWPEPVLTLDNAAMIAGLAAYCYNIKPVGDSFDRAPMTRIMIG